MELLHKDGVHIGKQTINNQKAILVERLANLLKMLQL